MSSPPPSIETLVCGPLGNNVYVVASPETAAAMVVDPAMGAVDAVQAVLRDRAWSTAVIVASHSHWDHVAEAALLAERTGAPVLAHTLDAPTLIHPRPSRLFPEVQIPPIAVTRTLAEGDVIDTAGYPFQVLHTPGHTPGSICLYLPEHALLLSGDTLFAGSFGRYDLPGGDPHQLHESLRRLARLPPATRVLPGHGNATTIGAETWLRRPPLPV